MAAVYLNALYARNPQGSESSFVHSRNVSTISNTTFFTSTSIHSQPTEPLLHATTPQTINYNDQLDHVPRNRNETIERLPCEDPLLSDGNPLNEAKKKSYWTRHCRRPLKRSRKWLKLSLQASLAAWAIYNTVRYFMAFADFGDSTNQSFCLALGTSTGISFLLTLISFLLAIRDRKIHGVMPSYFSYVRLTLDYFSTFCLLGPAVVNFALLFIWKDSVYPHFNLDNRCHLDIDVIWSVSNMLCNNKSPQWAIWLTLSILRLALTLIISMGYITMSSLYRPRRRRAIRGFRARTSEPSTPEEPVPSPLNLPLHRDSNIRHQLSDSTLCGTTMSEPPLQNQIRLARSHSSGLSQDNSPTKTITLGRSTITESENEHNPNEFVDRFRLMVSQIAQETDEALDLAHSEHSLSPETMNDIPIRDLPPSYEEDLDEFDDAYVGHSHNNIFNLPPIFPTLGYNEFGLPYPPDQNVRMLNGYIRRMPTIESMGSGEVGSSIGTSNRARESILTSSRPPTRNTLISWNSSDHDAASSEAPSRTNSLSARAELLVGLSSVASSTSEHGELLGRSSPVAQRLSTPISYVDPALGDSYSSTSGSRGTSYHTATSEALLPPGLILDTPSCSPVWEQQDMILDSEEPQSP